MAFSGGNSFCSSWDDFSEWSWEEHDVIERAFLTVPEDHPYRWQLIAGLIPGRSPAEVSNYCTVMLQDVYTMLYKFNNLPDSAVVAPPHQLPVTDVNADPSHNNMNKKRKPWTKFEHVQFIKGLKKYGKGDWKSIANYMGLSKRSSQVASHAQKFYLRQAQTQKQPSNRSSIHDITTVDDDDDDEETLPPFMPINAPTALINSQNFPLTTTTI